LCRSSEAEALTGTAAGVGPTLRLPVDSSRRYEVMRGREEWDDVVVVRKRTHAGIEEEEGEGRADDPTKRKLRSRGSAGEEEEGVLDSSRRRSARRAGSCRCVNDVGSEPLQPPCRVRVK
jgi:hypothetical protein